MDGFQEGIHALLQDINANYGDDGKEEHPLPFSRPNSNAYAQPPKPAPPSIYGQQQGLAHWDPGPSNTYHCLPNYPTDLDSFDRDLLDGTPAQPTWQSSRALPAAKQGRLTLPGHTAPHLPSNPFERRITQPKQPRSTRRYQPNAAQYIRTPPAQTDLSSPSNPLLSSPSFRVKERRFSHQKQPPVTKVRDTAFSYRLASQEPYDSPRGPTVQGLEDNKLQLHDSYASLTAQQSPPQPQAGLSRTPPIVQGIQLVSLDRLPDRLRSVFQYPLFNAIQSKCFPIAYDSNDNLIVSAPTGGGKTAILEMAVCRLVSNFKADQYKIVYMAPTKSLCSERFRDWQTKFAALDMQCAELTGDTEHGQLRSVQSASIIITTPEKWDSVTRKWKDHAKLMQMVKLFLIDEVHILKDARGATLEAVISRMKSVESNVRFVALSATVPNSQDIAHWLGKDPSNEHIPASQERFGEDFRPVKLQRHVIGLQYRGNDFGFETACDPKLPDIIAKYSHRKPIMLFCITRNSTISTAKLLANMWASKGEYHRYWKKPSHRITVADPELKNTLTSGVAFHHAGLDGSDRHAIEKGFLEGHISVICCTSTLAVGVNLPCHMVIIKNTMTWSEDGLKEYSDLEIMQMLGRAGRPQFDTSAIAVIITKQEKAAKYERLVSGEELVESCLHLHLIEHLNAEIGLGTIHNLYTAKRWLGGTFLYVRLGKNPEHYKLDGDAVGLGLNDRIEKICQRDLALLENIDLISSYNGRLQATELGDAMARYYVEFETMQALLRLDVSPKISDILSAVVQAKEFHEIRLKSYEKKLFREINGANGIKFPIKVDLAMHAHKRSLILQAELGGVEFPTDEQYAKYKRQFNQEKHMLFSHAHRLVHCVIDCQIHKQDAVGVRHALELARSFSARVWDNSPYELKQIPQIGLVAIRKLAIGGINSIEALEAAEPHRIEMLLSKNPPFGQKLLDSMRDFPKLRVSIKLVGKTCGKGQPVSVKIKAECGFMNDRVPMTFHKHPLYICLLTERSDGHLVDFKRISARNLSNGKGFLMSADLLTNKQYITSYIMCDAVAGTLRYAELRPNLPGHLFAHVQNKRQEIMNARENSGKKNNRHCEDSLHTSPETLRDDEFDGFEIEDQDMVDAVEGIDFHHVDSIALQPYAPTSGRDLHCQDKMNPTETIWNPEKLDNGKWACNHKCKDKTVCKHMCCRDGVDKAPKRPKNASVPAATLVDNSSISGHKEQPAQRSMAKQGPRTSSANATTAQSRKVETIDLVGESHSGGLTKKTPREVISLQRLHDSIIKRPTPATVPKRKCPTNHDTEKRPRSPASVGDHCPAESSDKISTDYSSDWVANLPSPSTLLGQSHKGNESQHSESYQTHGDCLPSLSTLHGQDVDNTKESLDHDLVTNFDISQSDDDNERSDLEAALVGFSDSLLMNAGSKHHIAPEDNYQEEDPEVELTKRARNASAYALQSTVPQFTASNKLFLSTDSPEKQADSPEKSRSSIGLRPQDSSISSPIRKRPKTSVESSTALQQSSEAGNRTVTPAPLIKPGQPAWVYDFDPAFIAEWQDIVDFI